MYTERPKYIRQIVLSILFFCRATIGLAGNVDPSDKYAYSKNTGWLNFEPEEGPGVTVADGKVSGRVWAENIGWINLDPEDDLNSGVKNDGTGLLTGFAWGENVGWINFNPNVPNDANHYGVTIDRDGNFSGWAWGENIGWIHFQSASPVEYKVATTWIISCVVGCDDLKKFCALWLGSGDDLKADFDGDSDVDFADYCYFAEQWLGPCPAGWPLKE